MVAGLEKSGATYVRQLLLDNLYVAPLDSHKHDHHNEPRMAALREAAGVGDLDLPRSDPAALGRAFLETAAASTTLVVYVSKDPYAWIASSVFRPHPFLRPAGGGHETDANVRRLLNKRKTANEQASTLAAALTRKGAVLEVVAYEDALRDPEAFVANLGRAYGLERRRGGHLLPTHHLTNDVRVDDAAPPPGSHGNARRARYATAGAFRRKSYYLDRDYLADLSKHLRTLISTYRPGRAAISVEEALGGPIRREDASTSRRLGAGTSTRPARRRLG